jgi:ribosomal protein L21E
MLGIIQAYRVRVQNLDGSFQAIHYKGDQCVVRVLPQQQGVHDNERLIKVKANDIIPSNATPVVCSGLKNATYFDGKIGDVRGFDEDAMRCKVHFEDKNILPKCVKPENLRTSLKLICVPFFWAIYRIYHILLSVISRDPD